MSDPVVPPRPADWRPEWPWPMPEPFASQFLAGYNSAPPEPVPVLPVAPIPHGPPLPPDPKPAPKAGTALGIEEDGYATFQFEDGPAKRLDLYEVNTHLAAIFEDVDDEIPDGKGAAALEEYLKRVQAYIAELGFGQVSRRAADVFDKRVKEACAGLKKVGAPEPTPD